MSRKKASWTRLYLMIGGLALLLVLLYFLSVKEIEPAQKVPGPAPEIRQVDSLVH